MPATLARTETFPIRLPYRRPIKWASVEEDGADYLILRMSTGDGLSGVSEGVVKPTWTGATLRSLSVVIEEVFSPILKTVDISDPGKVMKAISRIPGHELAKAMIDTACWDIFSQTQGRPLWQIWDGARSVPLSCPVTSQSHKSMAEEVGRMVEDQGVRALKIKGGLGTEQDCADVTAVGRAAGDRIVLYVDTNSAYRPEDVPAYVARMATLGVCMVEDPCKLVPTGSFSDLQRDCPMPIIVDSACTGPLMAKLFLDRGAESLVLKPGRFGFSESREIAALAARRRREVHVNVIGASSLGAIASLQLAAAIHTRNSVIPAEAAFFLQLREEYVHEPLSIRHGCVVLPSQPGFDRLIDWDHVRHLRPN